MTIDADRSELDRAIGEVVFNASNYPAKVVPHILGQDVGPFRSKLVDAVLAAGTFTAHAHKGGS